MKTSTSKFVLGVLVILGVLAIIFFVWPGPQLREAASATPVLTTRDPAIDALATSQAQPTAAPLQQATQGPAGQNQASVPATVPVTTTETTMVPEIVPIGQNVFGNWDVSYYDGVTDQMESWTFMDLDPVLWPVFPNVDNAGYPAANGVEYGMAESVFCQQDQTCDFEVAARSYRLFTGDYNIAGLSCEAKDGIGCAVVFFNVGDVTAFWASQKMHDGFTVTGRYWNGDVLPHAVWALLSNTVSNMLNLNSPLNQNGGANAGANCSVPGGCIGVDVTFVVTSGNQVLVVGHTIFNK